MTRRAPAADQAQRSTGDGDALVRAFARRVDRSGSTVAMRVKRRGIWQEIDWAAAGDEVARLSLGLARLGIGPGDRVAVMGRPTPEWVFADLATQSLGAATVGLYVSTGPVELARQLQESGARVFVAETLEYVDALLDAERAGGGRLVEHVLVASERGLAGVTDGRVRSLASVAAAGDEPVADAGAAWRDLVTRRTGSEVIRVVFTPGTTGVPKAVPLTGANLLGAWEGWFASWPSPPGPQDRAVSFLPLAHPAAAVFTVLLAVRHGVVTHFPEDDDTAAEALVEVSPTLLFAFPGVLDRLAAGAVVDLENGSRLKRRLYGLACRVGGPIAHQLVFRHLLNRFGFRRVRLALVAGGVVPPATVQQWRRWGLPVTAGYGLAEAGGLVATAPPGAPALVAVPGVELRLAGDGEILVRGAGVFAGYDRPPPPSGGHVATVDADGWLHTGDLGRDVPGGTAVLDRLGDVFTPTGGVAVVPSEVENPVRASSYVQDAMAVPVGQGRLGVLVRLDLDNVALWAREHRILFTSEAELVDEPAVVELIGGAVDAANDALAAVGSPHRLDAFRILPAGEDAALLTPIGTLRRHRVAERHDTAVAAMAAGRV